MKYVSLILLGMLMPVPIWAKAPPNVLFIAIDDLNDWIGCLGGHPQTLTPHLDRLASRGTLFTNAHCQAPLCNPSRASLLTGYRPTSTGIYGLAPGIRQVNATKECVTLPQTFTEAGYFTYTCGKIYHDGSIAAKDQAKEFNEWGPAPGIGKADKRFANLPGKPHPLMDWGPFPERDEDSGDYKIADAAIKAITMAPKDKPFFIACGFRLPHVPCFAPPAWFAKFPEEKVKLPPILENDRVDTPRFSWYLHWDLPEPRLKTLQTHKEWKPLVRAYLACIAFMDAQVGRVLAALDQSGRSEETIVVVWSDHGYHLGEKQITGKNTLWERSTRVPLIFAGPNISKGAECSEPVELLDIFPTLLELAKMPSRKDLEGLSLVPQLKDAKTKRERPALTTHNPGNHAVRTHQWRYIRYADGSEELYDMIKDPNEWKNLANDPEYQKIIRDCARWLPKEEKKHASGSAHRILVFDPETKSVTWEGKPIRPDSPIPE
jgi:arylsulfatase A-like enzyme